MKKKFSRKQAINLSPGLLNWIRRVRPKLNLLIIVSTSIIVGCSSTPNYAPVVPAPPTQKIKSRYYIIKKGDTLYSIGARSGHGYKTLSTWNRIPPPYKLMVGRKIKLFQQNQTKVKKKQKNKKISLEKKSKVISKNRHTSHKKQKVQRYTSQKKTTVKTEKKKLLKLQWKWPIHGKVIKNFSQTGNKRIDISGKTGQQVTSAASGKVVYSGSGLKGYGNLLIIKHNSIYLSAYANNRRLLVKEGQQVTLGQVIAEIGPGDGNQTSLHFEIRKNGNPVNPLHFLPKK